MTLVSVNVIWRVMSDEFLEPNEKPMIIRRINSETVRECAERRQLSSFRAPYGVGVTVRVGVTVGVGLTTTTVVEVPVPSLGNFLKVMKSVAPRTGATVT